MGKRRFQVADAGFERRGGIVGAAFRYRFRYTAGEASGLKGASFSAG
jgi:hypothetical protein